MINITDLQGWLSRIFFEFMRKRRPQKGLAVIHKLFSLKAIINTEGAMPHTSASLLFVFSKAENLASKMNKRRNGPATKANMSLLSWNFSGTL